MLSTKQQDKGKITVKNLKGEEFVLFRTGDEIAGITPKFWAKDKDGKEYLVKVFENRIFNEQESKAEIDKIVERFRKSSMNEWKKQYPRKSEKELQALLDAPSKQFNTSLQDHSEICAGNPMIADFISESISVNVYKTIVDKDIVVPKITLFQDGVKIYLAVERIEDLSHLHESSKGKDRDSILQGITKSIAAAVVLQEKDALFHNIEYSETTEKVVRLDYGRCLQASNVALSLTLLVTSLSSLARESRQVVNLDQLVEEIQKSNARFTNNRDRINEDLTKRVKAIQGVLIEDLHKFPVLKIANNALKVVELGFAGSPEQVRNKLLEDIEENARSAVVMLHFILLVNPRIFKEHQWQGFSILNLDLQSLLLKSLTLASLSEDGKFSAKNFKNFLTDKETYEIRLPKGRVLKMTPQEMVLSLQAPQWVKSKIFYSLVFLSCAAYTIASGVMERRVNNYAISCMAIACLAALLLVSFLTSSRNFRTGTKLKDILAKQDNFNYEKIAEKNRVALDKGAELSTKDSTNESSATLVVEGGKPSRNFEEANASSLGGEAASLLAVA